MLELPRQLRIRFRLNRNRFNVRRFAGITARLDGLGPGLNLVAAPNEAGKSTFFEAPEALIFLAARSGGAEARALQPYAGGAPEVEAEVELDGARFRIAKRWLQRPFSRVTELPSGRVVAQDDEAEAWIAGRIAAGGLPGMLWVRQGEFALEPEGSAPADKAERDRRARIRRDLLSSVAVEIDTITGGRRLDAIAARAEAATGLPKAKGRWLQAEDEAAALGGERARLDAQCADLAAALAERAEVRRTSRGRPTLPQRGPAPRPSPRPSAPLRLRASSRGSTPPAPPGAQPRSSATQPPGHSPPTTGPAAHTRRPGPPPPRPPTPRASPPKTSPRPRSAKQKPHALPKRPSRGTRRRGSGSPLPNASPERPKRTPAPRRPMCISVARRRSLARSPRPPPRHGRRRVGCRAVRRRRADRARDRMAAGAVALAMTYLPGVTGRVTIDGRPVAPGATVDCAERTTLDLPGLESLTATPGGDAAVAAGEVAEAEAALAGILTAAGAADLAALSARAGRRAAAEASAARASAAAEAAALPARAGFAERLDALQVLADAADRTVAALEAAMPNAAAAEARALSRLRDALASARAAARERYLAPVEEELRPLLGRVFGDADLALDPARLLPETLARGGMRRTSPASAAGPAPRSRS